MRRSDAAQLGLFEARKPAVPAEYVRALDGLREVLAPGEWVSQEAARAAAGDWAGLYGATRWGGLPAKEGEWRLPVAVRLASPECPVYARWNSPAAREWRAMVGIPG